MPLSTRSTGDLITATIWNALVNAINNTMAHKADGQTLEAWGATPKTIGWMVGDIKQSGAVADQGAAWLRLDGRTIGNQSSGATARANADMWDLFVFLWTNYTNTELVIQTSGGSPTTRGASAAADFSANKRMPLPDLRGRVLAGMDNPGSGAANRITNAQADINGGVMGAETHSLTSGENGPHTHGPSSPFTQYVQRIVGQGIVGMGSGADFNYPGSTGTSGSGTGHNNVQPTFFANYFIYTGN